MAILTARFNALGEDNAVRLSGAGVDFPVHGTIHAHSMENALEDQHRKKVQLRTRIYEFFHKFSTTSKHSVRALLQ